MHRIIYIFILLLACNDIPEENHIFDIVRSSAEWYLEDNIANMVLNMKVVNGEVEDVWFHGQLETTDSLGLMFIVSEDSVYIDSFNIVFDTTFSIYSQVGYKNRPSPAYITMWVTYE